MSYLSEQNADSPLSRWKFEETSGTTIDDDLTATRDGTINGGVTLNQAAQFTDGGLGADFNGSSGYVSFGNASGLLGIGTIEAVALFDTIPSGANANPIFSHAWTSGQIIPLVIGFNLDAANPGKLQVGYYTGSVWQTATWTTAPTTGKPYHIVGKYDGTTLKLRVNGTEVASTTVGTARPGSGTVNATGYIGRRWDSAQYHDGKIWDVAIYGAALSDVRIDAHYLVLANAFADNFANANAIFDGYAISGVDSTAWGTEGSEPGGVFNTGWVKFTPTLTHPYRLSTVGSNYDTVLNVYTGTALNNLVLVGNDDDSGGSGTSRLSMSLTSGTTYYIQVGSKILGGGSLAFALDATADARLGGQADEVITDASPQRRLAGTATESITDSAGSPQRRLAGTATESITDSAGVPSRRVAGVAVEVIVPSRLTFVGWGTPVNHPVWF